MLEPRRIIICVVIIFIVGSIIGYFVFINNQQNNDSSNNIIDEYIPEEEISDAQIRQTMISLYFKDEKGIIPEARYIDVKILMNNPYEELLKLLIEGPKSENLKNTIPDGTRINKIEKIGDTLLIELSKEFVLNQSEEDKSISIEAIQKTLTQFIEINVVIIKSID